ncbi:hypothetical protein PpBr36_02549 [Pyricularia pennisetigena]|uniref:hypothetical protein n=1 Tax=Pyricularia pennisetigena TaxID=1578925 RepID=UPI00114D8FA4|nr:hypothetical protein PpBr36_02549 [Pyricularia pennisetigena]TLS30764.1 hypothetical protein PpBr36_02549 [Pyricularia pennisetigena]
MSRTKQAARKNKRKAETQLQNAPTKRLTPPDDAPQAQAAVGQSHNLNAVVSSEEVEVAVDTLRTLAQHPAAIKSKACRDLRSAVYSFRQACTTGANSTGDGSMNLTARISGALVDEKYIDALVLLAEMRIRNEAPKLGALCRWVRDLDVTSGLSINGAEAGLPPWTERQRLLLRVLDAISRVTGTWDVKHVPVSTTSDPIAIQEIWSLREQDQSWPMHQSVLDGTIFKSCATDIKEKFQVLERTPGPDRKPPNLHDAVLYLSADNAVELSSTPPTITHHHHPAVPKLSLMKDVLSPDECRAIVGAMESIGYLPDAPIRDDGAEASILAHNVYWIVDQAFHDKLWDRVKPFVPAMADGRRVRGINRRFRVYRYVPGAEYRCHFDGAWPPSGVEPSTGKYLWDASPPENPQSSLFTFLVYLNDEFEGGETTFFTPSLREGVMNAYPVRPIMGSIALFPHGESKGFLELHPGGARVILKSAGRDATPAYESVHDPDLVASTLSPSCLVGTISQQSTALVPTAEEVPSPATDGSGPAQLIYPSLTSMLNVSDFERAAKKYISDIGWAYYSSGAEDEISMQDPRRIFNRITLRPRILRHVETIDTKCSFFGGRIKSSLPIYITPTGLSRYAHRDGDQCLARACGHEGIVYCMPTTAAHEVVFGARTTPNQPLCFQLYTGRDYDRTRALLQKVEQLGAAAIFVTVDSPVIGRRERDDRIKAADGEDPLFAAGVAKSGSMTLLNPTLTWDDLDWLRAATSLPLVLKGVQTVEDAVLAHRAGVDGIVLSNHGGRSQDTAQAPMLTLLEIRRHAPHLLTPETRSRFEVFLDGGVRRGTDVLKALALGASAVGVGRPALYSMTNGWGEAGVRRLIMMLRMELETNMALAGATRLDEVVPEMVNTERVEHEVFRRVKL